MNNLINNIIKEWLQEQNYITEYNQYDSFLSDYETAKKYAYDNIDDVAEVFDAYEKNPDNLHISYAYENYIDLIDQYHDKYNELRDKNEVTIYRLIKLNDIANLDTNNIGKHWSFEKEGVGAFGEQHPNRQEMTTGKPYILTGVVNPQDIDWIYSFHSFIYYGEDQWECSLEQNATVKIIEINDKKLDKPIIAKVGEH